MRTTKSTSFLYQGVAAGVCLLAFDFGQGFVYSNCDTPVLCSATCTFHCCKRANSETNLYWRFLPFFLSNFHKLEDDIREI